MKKVRGANSPGLQSGGNGTMVQRIVSLHHLMSSTSTAPRKTHRPFAMMNQKMCFLPLLQFDPQKGTASATTFPPYPFSTFAGASFYGGCAVPDDAGENRLWLRGGARPSRLPRHHQRQHLPKEPRIPGLWHTHSLWRTGRDSNPWWSLTPRRFSRPLR